MSRTVYIGSKLFVGWDSPGSFGASDVFSFHNQMIFTQVTFDSFDYSALELGLKHKLDLGAILARDMHRRRRPQPAR